MNKNAKNKQQQQRNALEAEAYLPRSKLLSTGVTDLGIPPALQYYLEVSISHRSQPVYRH